jgi:hypothetical protein
MTPPSHSLLVLAWDDADPGAHPATAPPTLPVLRQLAAHQPLLAVLPELPAELQTAGYQAEVAAQQRDEAADSEAATAATATTALATPAETPLSHLETSATLGTVLLPLATADAGVAASHIIGLADLGGAPPGTFTLEVPATETAAVAAAEADEAAVAHAAGAAPIATATILSTTILPAPLAGFVHTAPRPAQAWAAPAAPYLGSSPPPLRPEVIGSAEVADLQRAATPAPLDETPPAATIEGASDALMDPALGKSAAFPSITTLPAAAATEAADEAAVPAYLVGTVASEETPPVNYPTTSPTRQPTTQPSLPDAFAQTAAEVGTEEAADLYAAEDNLTLAPEEVDSGLVAAPLPEAPERASLAQALHALHRPATEPEADATAIIDPAAADLIEPEALPTATVPLPLSDNLHYRIIQYARFATHVAGEQSEEFTAIYAPNWPTWLAALEIRYRSRRPLVLHLTELAAAVMPPAERGWRLELERYAIRRAHTILVATDALRRQLLRHYGHPPGRLRVIAPDDEVGINAVLAKVGTAADF